MASSYPGAIDALTNPTGANNLSTPGVLHSTQHANANDAIEAVETALGANLANVVKGSATNARPWRDVSSYATAGAGTSASPWTGWETAFATLTGSTDLTSGANFVLYLPRGFYALSSTLAPPNSASHFVLKGAGKHATTITWTGGNSPMVKLVNARNVVIEDIALIGNATGANRPTYGVEVNRAAGLVGSPGPTAVRMRNVWMGGTSAAMMTTAIGFTADSGYDSNNDVGTFTDVEILNVGTGYKFGHVNTIWHTIIGGNVSFCTTAAIDNTPAGGVATGGTYRCFSTLFSGNAETFRLGPVSNGTIDLYGVTGESETKVITTPTALGAASVRVNFFGGFFSCVDPGGSNTIAFNSTSSIACLQFYGFSLGSPTGIKVSLPSAGPTMRVDGGSWVTATWAYACKLEITNMIEQAGSPTFTPSGAGTVAFVNYRSHLAVPGTDPVVSPGGGVGAGGAASLTSGSDTAGTLSITTGGTPGAATLATVSFASAYPVAPVVVFSAADADSALDSDKVYVANVSTTSWELVARVALTASTTFNFSYLVIGG